MLKFFHCNISLDIQPTAALQDTRVYFLFYFVILEHHKVAWKGKMLQYVAVSDDCIQIISKL